MMVKVLVYIFLPLLLWFSFIKVLEGILFPFYMGDLFLALALILLSLKASNLWTLPILFFLGVLKGIFCVGEIFWGIIFTLLGVAWEVTERYFKLETFKLRTFFWSSSIFLLSLVNLSYFFYRFKGKVNFELIISLTFKILLYFCLTFVWAFIIYFIIISFFRPNYDKVE